MTRDEIYFGDSRHDLLDISYLLSKNYGTELHQIVDVFGLSVKASSSITGHTARRRILSRVECSDNLILSGFRGGLAVLRRACSLPGEGQTHLAAGG